MKKIIIILLIVIISILLDYFYFDIGKDFKTKAVTSSLIKELKTEAILDIQYTKCEDCEGQMSFSYLQYIESRGLETWTTCSVELSYAAICIKCKSLDFVTLDSELVFDANEMVRIKKELINMATNRRLEESEILFDQMSKDLSHLGITKKMLLKLVELAMNNDFDDEQEYQKAAEEEIGFTPEMFKAIEEY